MPGFVEFKAGLKPGKTHKNSAVYQGSPEGTLVEFNFEFEGKPATVVFETLMDSGSK